MSKMVNGKPEQEPMSYEQAEELKRILAFDPEEALNPKKEEVPKIEFVEPFEFTDFMAQGTHLLCPSGDKDMYQPLVIGSANAHLEEVFSIREEAMTFSMDRTATTFIGFNAEGWYLRAVDRMRQHGVACPKCGNDILERGLHQDLAGICHCPKCGWGCRSASVRVPDNHPVREWFRKNREDAPAVEEQLAIAAYLNSFPLKSVRDQVYEAIQKNKRYAALEAEKERKRMLREERTAERERLAREREERRAARERAMENKGRAALKSRSNRDGAATGPSINVPAEEAFCPGCGEQDAVRAGYTAAGSPKARCRTCGKAWTLYPVKKQPKAPVPAGDGAAGSTQTQPMPDMTAIMNMAAQMAATMAAQIIAQQASTSGSGGSNEL